MFLPFRPIKRSEYFFTTLFIFAFPLLFLVACASTSSEFDFWWEITLVLSVLWFIWVIVSTLFNLYKKITFRLLPVCLVLNIGCFFGMLTYWREVGGELAFGIILLISYLSAILFAYFNPKFIFTFQYYLGSLKVFVFLLYFGSLPIIWFIYGLQIVNLSKAYLYAWGLAACSLFLTLLFTALTICYREPGWTPEQELKRNKEGKDF